MNPTVRLEPESDVPATATVRDYDELSDRAQAELPAMVDRESVALAPEDACGFVDDEYVNYLGFYRVRVGE